MKKKQKKGHNKHSATNNISIAYYLSRDVSSSKTLPAQCTHLLFCLRVYEMERSPLVLPLTKSTSFFFHCACIPLLHSEEVVAKIQSLETLHDVRITFTDKDLPPLEIAQAIEKWGKLFGTLQIKDITVPVGMNDASVACIPPLWYYASDGAITRKQLSVTDSSCMEQFFQFGGNRVTLSGEEYIVDFKEMKLRSKSEKVGILHRVPPFLDVPQQKVTVHISGQDSSIKKTQGVLLEVLDESLVKAEPIQWSVEPTFSSNIEQQIKNFVRQFCVLFDFFTADQASTLSLTGAPGYVEAVYVPIKQHIDALVKDLSAYGCSVSPLPKSPPSLSLSTKSTPSRIPLVSQLGAFHSGHPSLWERQIDKCAFLNVTPNSSEWTDVFKMMSATKPGIVLHKVERVQNTVLWERYSLEGKHMAERNKGIVNEKYLFHGTTKMDPYAVAKADCGVDFRYSMSNRRKSLMWGSGSYFAVNFNYSNMFSYKCSSGKRQVILVSVLTGHSHSYGKSQHPELTKPPSYVDGGTRLYDTVNGETGGSVVYVVYDHCKSCPAYIMTYTSPLE